MRIPQPERAALERATLDYLHELHVAPGRRPPESPGWTPRSSRHRARTDDATVTRVETLRNVAFAVLGASGLVLKPSYHGPLEQVVFAYGGNVAVSLALYFAALSGAARRGLGRPAAALGTLLAVEAFEVTNGFGVMANTYDPLDLAANAAGVGLALVLDVATSRLLAKARTGTVTD